MQPQRQAVFVGRFAGMKGRYTLDENWTSKSNKLEANLLHLIKEMSLSIVQNP